MPVIILPKYTLKTKSLTILIDPPYKAVCLVWPKRILDVYHLYHHHSTNCHISWAVDLGLDRPKGTHSYQLRSQ